MMDREKATEHAQGKDGHVNASEISDNPERHKGRQGLVESTHEAGVCRA